MPRSEVSQVAAQVTLVQLVDAAVGRLRANGVLVQLGSGYAIATGGEPQVPVQMWRGRAQFPVQMWRGAPRPGADEAGGESSPGADVAAQHWLSNRLRLSGPHPPKHPLSTHSPRSHFMAQLSSVGACPWPLAAALRAGLQTFRGCAAERIRSINTTRHCGMYAPYDMP